MKLKKLLPIATMTGITAVVAPLVTSCSQNGTMISWSMDDYVEGELPFNNLPEYTGEDTFADAEAATKAYLAEVNKDKTLFTKELINSIVWLTAYISERVDNPAITAAETIKNIKVRTDKVDVENCTLSFYVEEQVKWVPVEGGASINYTATFEAKNLKMLMTTRSPSTYPALIPYLWYLNDTRSEAETFQEIYAKLFELANDKSWSYTIHQESSLGNVVDQFVDYSNVLDFNEVEDVYLVLDSWTLGSMMVSTYFDGITITSEGGK